MQDVKKEETVSQNKHVEFPYFWGPYSKFRVIKESGFESDEWLQHCENYYNQIIKNNFIKELYFKLPDYLLRYLPNMPKRSMLDGLMREHGTRGSIILDIGGGWGDNYLKFKQRGAHFAKGKFFVLDNAKQKSLGEKLLRSEAINFVDSFQSIDFDVTLLIGTLQYIEDWKGLLTSLTKTKCQEIIISRTPWALSEVDCCAVQSIVPHTIGYKVGEENLNVLSFENFIKYVNKLGWHVEKIGDQKDYSANFSRFPERLQNVIYQELLLVRDTL